MLPFVQSVQYCLVNTIYFFSIYLFNILHWYNLQVRVLASDNGLPPRTAYALVYIYIQHNFRAPTWPQNSYNTSIPEIQALGTNFLTIIASDLDSQVKKKLA